MPALSGNPGYARRWVECLHFSRAVAVSGDPLALRRSPLEVGNVIQKIGMFILVTFALIALIKEPQTISDFVNAISEGLRTIAQALGDLFDSVG